MKPLGTLLSIISNGSHGNDDRYKRFDFSFSYIFPSSMTVQSFITIKRQGKKSSVIKFFKLFVSDHLNGRNKNPSICAFPRHKTHRSIQKIRTLLFMSLIKLQVYYSASFTLLFALFHNFSGGKVPSACKL